VQPRAWCNNNNLITLFVPSSVHFVVSTTVIILTNNNNNNRVDMKCVMSYIIFYKGKNPHTALLENRYYRRTLSFVPIFYRIVREDDETKTLESVFLFCCVFSRYMFFSSGIIVLLIIYIYIYIHVFGSILGGSRERNLSQRARFNSIKTV